MGVEPTGRKRVAHGPDPGGAPIRPALVRDIENHRHATAAGPTKVSVEARDPRPSRHRVGTTFHRFHPPVWRRPAGRRRNYIRSNKSPTMAGFSPGARLQPSAWKWGNTRR